MGTHGDSLIFPEAQNAGISATKTSTSVFLFRPLKALSYDEIIWEHRFLVQLSAHSSYTSTHCSALNSPKGLGSSAVVHKKEIKRIITPVCLNWGSLSLMFAVCGGVELTVWFLWKCTCWFRKRGRGTTGITISIRKIKNDSRLLSYEKIASVHTLRRHPVQLC